MTKLKIKRTSEWNNRARNFGVYIDGDKIGTIGNGQTKEFDLEYGKHQLKAKIDWCQSQILEIEIQENETKMIELSGFKYGNFIIPIFSLILLSHFLLKIVFDFHSIYILGLAISIFLYPMYYITFGRTKYIRVRELN